MQFSKISGGPCVMAIPSFVFFDLGNVIVRFDNDRACQQMGKVCGVAPEMIREIAFDGPLRQQYETGQLSTPEFHDAICQATSTRPDFDALVAAGSDIFCLNLSIVPVIVQLRAAGVPMGLLSNTSESHWRFLSEGRFTLLKSCFSVYVLSYQVGAAKPDPAIYEKAAEMAGVEPSEVLFIDDLETHVTGARTAGFDAVQYKSTPQLVEDLRQRGFRFNY